MILDYSYARPDPGAMKAAGVLAVMRYLSPTPAKNLSAAERDALHAAGVAIGLVWESTATRAAQGFGAGQGDAIAANAQADALGYPAGCPIFYAVDYAATPAAVGPYFQGVGSVGRRPVGVYGSASVVEGVPVPWKWQTVAWSAGRVSAVAHMLQTTAPAPFVGTDVNRPLASFPLWAAGGVTTTGAVTSTTGGVAPVPTLNPLTPIPTEDDMPKPLIWRRFDGAAMILTAEGPQGLSNDHWNMWAGIFGGGDGEITPKGMFALDGATFAGITASLTRDDTAQIVAGVVAALPVGTAPTAAQIADELAKRLAS